MKFLRYLREQASQAVQTYFAPLKLWRHALIVLLLLASAFIPVRDWFFSGFVVLDMTNMMIYMFWAIMMFIGIPMFAMLFAQMYESVHRYRVTLILGSWLGLAFGLWMITNSPFYSNTDGVVVVEDGQATVLNQYEAPLRYPIWEEREFRVTNNAYGNVETVVYAPCENTMCATTLKVEYAFTEPFIAANTDNALDYRSVVAVALIKAANVDDNLTPDTIAPAMCANINANLGLDENSACAVRLTFSATVEKI